MDGGNHKTIPFTNLRVPPRTRRDGTVEQVNPGQCKSMLLDDDKKNGIDYFLNDDRAVTEFVMTKDRKRFDDFMASCT